MPNQVGAVVLYQPTQKESPMNSSQQAAIVTVWNTDTEQASLVVFGAGRGYIVEKDNVAEGTDDGTFQQLGSQSASAKAAAEAKKAQEKTDTEAAKRAQEDARRTAKEAPHAAAR